MAAETVTTSVWANFMNHRRIFPAVAAVYRIKSVLLSYLQGRGGRFDPGGRVMEINFETSPNPSYGNIGESEQFVEPSSPTATLGYAAMKTANGRFRVTERAILASKGNGMAWASAKLHNMENLAKMFGQHQSRELFLWGVAAHARVKSIAGQVLTLFEDQESGGGQTPGARYFLKGARYSNHTGALTDANPDGTSDLQVTGVSGNAVTFQGAMGDMAANDYLILGSKERTSMNRAMIGLLGALDDGTLLPNYLGLARSSNTFLNAKVRRDIGALDLDKVIQTQMDTLWTETEAEIDLLITTVGVRRAYFDQHVPELRYISAAETGKFKGNFRFLAFQSPTNNNEVLPIDVERDCPKGMLFGLNLSTFYFGELAPPGWFHPQMDDDNIWMHVPEYAAWDAVMRTHREFICKAPLLNFVLQGITEA